MIHALDPRVHVTISNLKKNIYVIHQRLLSLWFQVEV